MFKSKKAKILTSLGALVLIIVVGGFAFTRGYFMRFNVNGEDISRDQYFQMAETVNTTGGSMYCAPQWTLGLVYFYEVVCFDTQEEVNAYMEQRKLMMNEQLLDSWDLHNHMLFMLFDAIAPEGFAGTPVGMSGRSVGHIFAHIHSIRLAWIEPADSVLMQGLTKIPTKTKTDRDALTKDLLRPALESSTTAIRTLLENSLEKGKIKGMKPHLVGSFSYFIAHEWYHIGEIGMTLTLSGHKLDDQTAWGIWSWDRWTPGGKA